MTSPIKKLHSAFTDHPREAGESYWHHFCFTVGMSGRLFVCSFLLLIHGILPFTLTHVPSSKIKKCQRILSDRAARTGYDELKDGCGI